MKGRIRGKAWG